jgi:hypothetical protein
LRRTVTACLTILAVSGLAFPTAIPPAGAATPAVPARPDVPGARPTPATGSIPALGATQTPSLPGGIATASRSSRLREEAAKVQAEIDGFDDDIADLVEEYDTHQDALRQTRVAMQQTAVRLDSAQTRLDLAKRQLRRRARAAYIWERDPISRYSQLLGVRGLHDVAAAHGYQSWVMSADERAVAKVTLARRSLEILSRRLELDHDRQTDLLDRLGKEKESISKRLRERKRYLEELTDQILEAVAREDRSQERKRHKAMLRRLAEDRRERARDRTRRPVSYGRAGGGSLGRIAIRWALRQVGKPYRWGASGPGAFDCSGLTMRAYQTAGVRLPHSSRAQYQSGRRLQRLGDIRPGDLLFFGRGGRSIHHVGLYIGNGRMVHAPYSGTRVRVSSIGRRNFVGAARP